MSLLPQHKKSAEEIAKLRESLGIPGPSPVEEELPAKTPVPAAATKQMAEPLLPGISTDHGLATLPVAEVHAAKPVRSLKRSERIPVLAVEDDATLDQGIVPLETPAIQTESPPRAPHAPKPVRSLRKSEQIPLPADNHPESPADSKLPGHRHSDKELDQIRRQGVIAMQAVATHPMTLKAHPALVIPGYLAAAAGAVGYYFYDLHISITAVCVAAALLDAAFIFFKKPLSLHHAAFIAVLSLFVIVFGALYYFPQLRHGT